MSDIAIGHTAPNFTLTDQAGKIFTLSDETAKQPVVLVFYPMGGTPNCDRLLCDIDIHLDEFNAAGLTVVGINYADEPSHERYVEKRKLDIRLLSDQNYRVSEAYDSLFSIGPIKVIRYSIVGIGTDGLIKYHHRGRPGGDQIISAMTTPASTSQPAS